jgi:SM-20-related protein
MVDMVNGTAADSLEASQIDVAVEKLGDDGYSVTVGLLPLDLVQRLAAEQRRREETGQLATARVGRGAVAQALGAGERQVQSSWLNVESSAERDFMAFAERLRLAINRRLMLGLFEFEAQFLLYPAGGFYRRHIDALHGGRSRVVSLVAYLNEAWTSEDGGALAVWAAADEDVSTAAEPVAEVMPLAGTVVLMLSEQIPHEARVALRQRRAIAGWFRVNASSAQRVDVAR